MLLGAPPVLSAPSADVAGAPGRPPAREFDCDVRFCASGVLGVARARLQAAVVRVLEVLKGSPLDVADVDTARLPPCLGGFGLRLPAEPEADASYLACWSAHVQDVRRLAAALGRPLHHDPDAELAAEAASRLRAFGVDFTPGRGMTFTAEAQSEYASGPFVADTPVSDVFSFVGDVDDSSPAPRADAGSAAARLNPPPARLDARPPAETRTLAECSGLDSAADTTFGTSTVSSKSDFETSVSSNSLNFTWRRHAAKEKSSTSLK